MSRSYRKHYSDYHDRGCGCEFEPPRWGRIRARNRGCIHDEMHSFENGHTVFPDYYWNDWRFSGRICHSKKMIRNEIRTEYFTRTGNILNNRPAGKDRGHQTCKEEFLRGFRKIRGETQSGNSPLPYAWLDTKEAKQMVKAWKGDPLDVIYELARKGVIERAVHLECKKRLRK